MAPAHLRLRGANRSPLNAANAEQTIGACQPPKLNIGLQCRRSWFRKLVNALDLALCG
jgi:hypothetical protein